MDTCDAEACIKNIDPRWAAIPCSEPLTEIEIVQNKTGQ